MPGSWSCKYCRPDKQKPTRHESSPIRKTKSSTLRASPTKKKRRVTSFHKKAGSSDLEDEEEDEEEEPVETSEPKHVFDFLAPHEADTSKFIPKAEDRTNFEKSCLYN